MNTSHYDLNYYSDKESLPEYLTKTIAELLNKNCSKNVLEVGCGTGFLLRYLKNSGFKCYGCDISFFAAKASCQVNASALELPFCNNSMDAVIAISLIEHLHSAEALKFIAEARRVLKKGGVFFIVTPNRISLKSLIFGAKRIHSGDPTHVFIYSPFSLRRVLMKKGFMNISSIFKFPKNCSIAGWPVPNFIKHTKFSIIKNFVNWLFISSPFYILRDSFWLASLKR